MSGDGLHSQQVLRNKPIVLNHKISCNPSSIDPDTGILSCGNNLFCKPSYTSELGGICAHMLHDHEDLEKVDAPLDSVSQMNHVFDHPLASNEGEPLRRSSSTYHLAGGELD